MKVTWDIETVGLGGALVLGGIYNGTDYYEFHDFKEMLLLLPNEDCTIYAHNGAKYDNRYLLKYIKDAGLEITGTMFLHSGLIFTVIYNGFMYEFRDSMHLMVGSLKSLCKGFDIGDDSKKEFDIKSWIASGCPETAELKEYLKYDCISLYRLLEKFENTFDVEIKLTIASTAFNVLLNTEYKGVELKKLCTNYLTKEIEDNIRLSFKGGRVEVFKRRGQNLFKYDVNSLYPAVMRNENYPYGKMIEHPGDTCKKFVDHGFLGILKCNIISPKQKYPYLAKRHDDKLMFMEGEWADWITSIEYLEAIKRGYKIEIETGYIWAKKGKTFKEFEDKYYLIKEKSSGGKKEVAKRFLNTCFGKFGQSRTQKSVITEDKITAKNIDYVEMLDNDGFLFSIEKTNYGNRKINPAYAAFITAYARHELYLGFEEIINADGEIFYCDTDCIVSDKPMRTSLIHPTRLGAWDDEGKGETFEDSIFISPKLYTMKKGSELCIKGKGFDNEKLKAMRFNDFIDLLNGKEFKISCQRVTGVLEHFTRKATDKKLFIQGLEQDKIMKNDYNKRELVNNIETIAFNYNYIVATD